MKFDELEKIEGESRPKDNIVIAIGEKRRSKTQLPTLVKKHGLNVGLGLSIMGAGVAVVTLGSTLVSMAMNGTLASVFQALASM